MAGITKSNYLLDSFKRTQELLDDEIENPILYPTEFSFTEISTPVQINANTTLHVLL